MEQTHTHIMYLDTAVIPMYDGHAGSAIGPWAHKLRCKNQ